MSFQNLFLAKLPRDLTDADLCQIFESYNPISAKVMLEASTGMSKGFGFVLFKSEVEGHQAYEGMNHCHVAVRGHNFNLVIYPSQHNGKVATSASPALYIRNIPVTVPQAQVKQFLASFGNLLYCAMREDHHGNPVWVVYAEYDSIEGSKNALQKLHGSNCYFRSNVYIMAKYADSEESKQERRRRRDGGQIGPAPQPVSHFPLMADTYLHPLNSVEVMANCSKDISEVQTWQRLSSKNSSLVESPITYTNSNSNSFDPETPDDGLKKGPIHAYCHNPYAMECLGTKSLKAPTHLSLECNFKL